MGALEHTVSFAASSGNFLVSPNLGLMVWTLVAFLITLFVLKRLAFPRIAEAIDKRQKAIDESIEAAERARREADTLLEEYRQRLKEARAQAEEIVVRARKAAETVERESVEGARETREEILEQARKDAETSIQQAVGELRKEMADLTVLATEKVTRKALTEEDQRKLVEEALSELDFTALSGEQRRN
jgi:F-type H+-transporting ATPase subunit b